MSSIIQPWMFKFLLLAWILNWPTMLTILSMSPWKLSSLFWMYWLLLLCLPPVFRRGWLESRWFRLSRQSSMLRLSWKLPPLHCRLCRCFATHQAIMKPKVLITIVPIPSHLVCLRWGYRNNSFFPTMSCISYWWRL